MLSQIVQESVESTIGKFNAEILNNFQKQGTPEMPLIAYDERVCLIPAMVASSENNKKLLISSQISLLEEMQKWAEEKAKHIGNPSGFSEMASWSKGNKESYENLIIYLQDQITKCKEVLVSQQLFT